jgi:hypothetical protein
MKASILFSIFSVFFVMASGQVNQIENLQNIIKNDKEDTFKVRHLNTLIYLLAQSGNAKEVLEAGNMAIGLAQKINYQRRLANAYNNMAEG